MATVEEDLEHVNEKSTLAFIYCLNKMAAYETDPEDEDITSGPAFAATRAAAYPRTSLRTTV